MSGEAKIKELFDDAEIKEKVVTVWTKVFEASNKVITHANHYGFLAMETVPKPNIHEMMVSLQILSAVLDILISNADKLDVAYESTRLMLNAKEQITRMERLATALKANNRADFDVALDALECQAVF